MGGPVWALGDHAEHTARGAVCALLRVVSRGMLRVVQGRRDTRLRRQLELQLAIGAAMPSLPWRRYVFASQQQAATAEFVGVGGRSSTHLAHL